MTARLATDAGHDDLARTLRHVAAASAIGEDQSRPFDLGVWRRLAEVGAFGIVARGGSPSDLVAALEALGAEALAGPVLPAILVATLPDGLGTEVESGASLPAIADGDPVVPWGAGADSLWLVEVKAGAVSPAAWAAPPAVVRSLAGDAWARGNVVATAGAVPARDAIALADLAAAAYAVGAAGRALALTLEYTSLREQFGSPLLGFQTVAHRLAQADSELETAAGLTVMAAAVAPADHAVAAAARRRAVDAAISITLLAHHLHGALGFVDSTLLAALSRRVHQLMHAAPGRDAGTASVLSLVLV